MKNKNTRPDSALAKMTSESDQLDQLLLAVAKRSRLGHGTVEVTCLCMFVRLATVREATWGDSVPTRDELLANIRKMVEDNLDEARDAIDSTLARANAERRTGADA